MSNHDKTLVERRDNVAIYRDGPGAYAAIKRVSWGAVFAGAVTALATLTLLNLLGLAIGFAEINPTQEANPLGGLGIGSAIWLAVSSLIALFAGGWVAGRLAGFPKKSTSMIHGVLTWAVFSIFSIYFASSAVGSIFNTVGNTLSRTASLAANGVQAVAQPVGNAAQDAAQTASQNYDLTVEDIRREATALLEDTDDPSLNPNRIANAGEAVAANTADAAQRAVRNPAEAGEIVNEYVNSLSDRASNIASDVDKEDLASVIAERRNMSEEQALQMINGWESRLGRASESVSAYASDVATTVQDRAPEIAENVAGALAKAALFAFFGLLLGAIAAAFGGLSGRQLDAALLGDRALAARDVEGA